MFLSSKNFSGTSNSKLNRATDLPLTQKTRHLFWLVTQSINHQLGRPDFPSLVLERQLDRVSFFLLSSK